MEKSIFYKLFGVGKIPPELQMELRSEGLILLDEGIKGSVTYKNFRSPRRIASWKRSGLVAAIAITNVRLLAVSFSRPIVNIPFSDTRFKMVKYSQDKKALLIAFDASLFHDDWSGTIEYRFQTSDPQRFLELITNWG